MHIDHGIEEPTQSSHRSRSPRTRSRTRKEDLRQAADSAPDDTDPSEEGMESFVPAWVEELVTTGSEPSHDLGNGVTSVGMMSLSYCKSFVYHEL
ncbi:hypothetical protein U9M48_003419 [Paspalum notatum var. saurae]|uniref:Uncharacterized protein n=1 Tax=Paspalum notatum var. saurae TaxID=547442 RepID=A0AAQ3PIZ6_PASNO